MADRKPIFDAVRAWLGRGIKPEEVILLDDTLDSLSGTVDHSSHGRRINAEGLALIKESEGCVLTAYRDAVNVLTIGYGSTGPHVKPGMTITQAQAEALLRDDLERFEDAVDKLCSPCSDNEFASLVSFAFNLGENALKDSTLRRKHLEGDRAGAAAEFLKWNKARIGGVLKPLKGLTTRRQRESKLYLKP